MYRGWLRLLLNHHRLIALAVLAWVLVCCAGLLALGQSNDLRVYFADDDSHTLALNRLEHTFQKQDALVVFVKTRDPTASVITKATLATVAQLTDALWRTPFSRRVDALTNFQRTRAQGDEIFVGPLVEDIDGLSADALNDISNFAHHEPQLAGRFLSDDERVTALIVHLSLPETDAKEFGDLRVEASREAYDFVANAVASARKTQPQLEFHIGGSVVANLAVGEAVSTDLRLLLPLSYTLLLLVLLFFMRNLAATFLTLGVVSLSMLSALGLFGYSGGVLTPPIGFVPVAIITIALADCVHLWVSYAHALGQQSVMNKGEAIKSALMTTNRPIVLTSLTTIIGVLTLNFSDSPPYRDLGNLIAVGSAIAMLLTLVLMPALMLWLPLRFCSRQPTTLPALCSALANWVIQHPRALTLCLIAAVAAGLWGLNKNHLSERWYTYFDDHFEIRRTLDAIEPHLQGVHVLHFTLDSGSENGINSPAFLSEVDAFAQWLRHQPQVVHVDSPSDMIKRINLNMHGDDEHYYRIPQQRDLAGQYLMLYEISLPRGLGIDNAIDMSHRALRLSVLLGKSDSAYLIELDQAAGKWLEKHGSHIAPNSATGIDIMFSHVSLNNSRSMLLGMVVALVGISLLLIGVLRSWRLGMLSLVPNLVPGILTYGVWGIIDGKIDLSASVVICISLGIVVDDTVHFLNRYNEARAGGRDSPESIRHAFRSVGVAMFITSLALVSGFVITAWSHFQPSANLGFLLALTLSLALIVDLLLLPALLLLFDRKPRTAVGPTYGSPEK